MSHETLTEEANIHRPSCLPILLSCLVGALSGAVLLSVSIYDSFAESIKAGDWMMGVGVMLLGGCLGSFPGLFVGIVITCAANTRKATYRAVVAATVIFPGLLFSVYSRADYTLLARLSTSFASIRHPASTRHVKSVQKVETVPRGRLGAFFVAEMRTYQGSQRQIQDFYMQQKLRNPLNNAWQPVEVVFYQRGQQHISQSLPDYYNPIQNWALPRSTIKQPLYVVYFLHSEDPSE